MNTKKSIRSFFALGAILFVFASVAFGQTTSVVQRLRFASFGMQTLDAGRTARLSVVHNALPGNQPAGAPATYAVKAYFDVYSVRASDGALRFLRRVSREATLLAGEGLTLDFTPPLTTTGDGTVRLASTVYIKRMSDSDLADDAAPVGVSLEIRNREGTMFLLPGTIRGFNPQPDPPHEIGGILF